MTIKTDTRAGRSKLLDMAKTIEPNSEQINADDLISGPRTVTITGVKGGTVEQPVFIELAEFPGRTFRPAKTVRKLILAGWGDDAKKYVGRRLTIFNDPTVKWAGKEVGGIRISHMSDISSAVRVNLMVTRGKREPFVVEPLTVALPDGWEQDVAGCESVGDIQEFFEMASAAGWWSPVVAAACTARKAALAGAQSREEPA